jgi:palmitoyltransferase ZDHHC13/17
LHRVIGNYFINTELIESSQAGVMDRGEGNVTALHWAAINNHLAVAQYLLDKGAEIDAVGGWRGF